MNRTARRPSTVRRTPALLLAAIGLLAAAVARALPPAPAPFLSFEGEVGGDQFGTSVAASGDVSGDGYDDVVVGAQWNDAEAPNAGRAYVYFGGPGADGRADVTLGPDLVQSRALLGYAVAIVGDVNGDGRAEVAVGAPVSRFAGRVFLYYGGPALHGAPDRILAGLKLLEFFGGSVSGVGDVDGDGYGDVYVGAPWFVPLLSTATRTGRGYLFFGRPSGGSVVDVVMEARPISGFTGELQFGVSVAAAGDVNGDGYDDILVGQPGDGAFVAGRVFVFHGGIPVHRFPDVQFLSEEFRFRTGRAVSRAGDFDADGVEDYATGAPDSGENGALTGGRAFLYRGGQSGDEVGRRDFVFAESDEYDGFGTAIAAGADVNGDDWPDLLVGAPQAAGAAGIRAGRVYVYYGGPGADAVADRILEGPAAEAAFGASIALGDVNGDGTADAVIGAPGTLGAAGDPGHVYVYDLTAPLPARAFAHDEHRAIPLTESGSPILLRLEPRDGAFSIADVDPASLRLAAEDPGAGAPIAAIPAKRIVARDSDGNGIEEMEAAFERADLGRLFAFARGRREVTAALTGALASGRTFLAEATLAVVGTGPPSPVSAWVSPNPLNPVGVIAFTTSSAGAVDARLYDVTGRLVRVLAAEAPMAAGTHRLRLDGRDGAGAPLASGVYFYRLRTPEGDARGRFVVAK